MGDRFEEIAMSQARTYFTTPNGLENNFTASLRAIETLIGGGATLQNPRDYKLGAVPNWNRTPCLFFIAGRAVPPHGGGGIRERIREVMLVIGVSYTGTTDTDADELTILRYIAAIRRTVEQNFQLGSVSPLYISGCIEVEADMILDLTDHSATRKSRYVQFVCVVQDNS